MDASSDQVLVHYGVKGMRWGVRKRSGGSGAEASSRPRKPKRTDLSDVSDEELRKRINRLDMEKRYRDLAGEKQARQRVFDGQRFASNVVQNSATTVATTVATAAGIYAAKKAIERSFGPEAVSALFKK